MKKWKAIIGVVLVFVLGAVAGAIVSHRVCQHRMETIVSGGPKAMREFIFKRMDRELRLDAGQRAQLQAIFQETHEQIKAVRGKTQPQVDEIINRADDRVRAILRPDQRDKFEKFVEERKARKRHGD
jgi:hypothetical protein